MEKINCLLRNTRAVETLKRTLAVMVGDRIDNDQSALFPEVFKELREMGVEIDAESLGVIYGSMYSIYNSPSFSTVDEVEEFSGMAFKRQLQNVANEILKPKPVEVKSIGVLSPEKQITNKISQLFQKATFGAAPSVKTAMLEMQEMVFKAVKAKLPRDKSGSTNTLTDALNKFFQAEGHAFQKLDGSLNTLETLFDEVKVQLANYMSNLSGSLNAAELDFVSSKWDVFIDSFQDSLYDIVLGKAEQNTLLNKALQQVRVDGMNILDVNGNIRWSALIEYGNEDTIVDKVKTLFESGFTNPDGTATSYTARQSQMIGEYFRKLYVEKLNEAKSRAINNARTKRLSAQNLIADYIKDSGYFNLVKDKNGKLLLTQANWTELMKQIRNEIGDKTVLSDPTNNRDVISGIDYVNARLEDYLRDKHPTLSQNQIDAIKEHMVDVVAAKLSPKTNDATDIERLIALSNVHGGNAFNEETQQALNKVLGVSNLSQQILNKIMALTKAAQVITNNSIGVANTSPSSTINRGAYAFTAVAEIDRKIKELLRENTLNESDTQRIVSYFSDIMGAATVSLLINPNNSIENINTQLATNFAESVQTLFKSPRLFFKTFGTFQKAFWTQWLNYVTGGASNDIANESDLSNELQSSERLRVRSVINEVKDRGIKGVGSVAAKSPAYLVSIFSRTVMNSFDAATTSSLMRKSLMKNTIQVLKEKKKSNKEIRQLLDKVFNITPEQSAEIDAENNRVMSIVESSGIHVTPAMKAMNKQDLLLSYYEDILNGIAPTDRQATEATKVLVESAQAQSKMLGGKRQMLSNDLISTIIYGGANWMLKPQKNWFERSRRSQESGNLRRAAKFHAMASIYQNTISRFVGGVANFMNLAISATPLGAFQYASLKGQAGMLAEEHNTDVFGANPDALRKYSILHGQMRSVATRSIMGSLAMAAVIIYAYMDDEEERGDSWLSRLMQTKSGKRFIMKHLPVGVAMVSAVAYDTNDRNAQNVMKTLVEMYGVYTNKGFDSYSNLEKGLKYAKGDDDILDMLSRMAAGLTPTFNINQAEQIAKFKDVVQSAFDENEVYDVEKNEGIAREIYTSAEGIIDNLLLNGAIDAVRRFLSPDEKSNRYE